MMEFFGVPLLIAALIVATTTKGSIAKFLIAAVAGAVSGWLTIAVLFASCQCHVLPYRFCGEITGFIHIALTALAVTAITSITTALLLRK